MASHLGSQKVLAREVILTARGMAIGKMAVVVVARAVTEGEMIVTDATADAIAMMIVTDAEAAPVVEDVIVTEEMTVIAEMTEIVAEMTEIVAVVMTAIAVKNVTVVMNADIVLWRCQNPNLLNLSLQECRSQRRVTDAERLKA